MDLPQPRFSGLGRLTPLRTVEIILAVQARFEPQFQNATSVTPEPPDARAFMQILPSLRAKKSGL